MSLNPLSLRHLIANRVLQNCTQVEAWFQEQFRNNPPPFYSSVDLRDSGHKIAPVDCNLFPGGFNNICEIDLKHATTIAQHQIAEFARQMGCDIPKKIVILPEAHTQNRFYIENLITLKTILESASFGFGKIEIRIGWMDETVTEPFTLTSATERICVAEPFQVTDEGKLHLNHFTPDWIILNHDLSGGFPERLRQVNDSGLQPILPPLEMGWYTRKKSTHFRHYNRLAKEFAELIQLDPWHLMIESEPVGPVNFNEGIGIDPVIAVAEKMFKRLEAQNQAHGVDRKPALFIKNDSGTYGMGILVDESIDDLKQLNRREKNKMSVGKNRSTIDQVIIQEGIPTRITQDGATAEPVIYMMGTQLLGGFMRTNTERSDLDNLNSAGMIFKKLCFKDYHDLIQSDHLIPCLEKSPQKSSQPWDELPLLEAVYGVIARLSAIAAGIEIKEKNT